MNSLRTIIAMLLADLTCAQNSANQLSAALSEKYRVHPVLRFFPVPNALLNEAEFTLRLAFREEAIGADSIACVPDPPSAGVTVPGLLLSDLAWRIASVLAQRVAEVAGTMGAASVERQPGSFPAAALRDKLVQRLTPELDNIAGGWLDDDDIPPGTADRIGNAACNVLVQALRDTSGPWSSPEETAGRSLDGPTRLRIAEIVESTLQSAAGILSLIRSLPSMNVIAGVSELAGFPEYLVHSIRIKAQLRNYRWVIVEPGDPQGDQLVVES